MSDQPPHLFLGHGNMVVCIDHKNLVEVVRWAPQPLTALDIERYAIIPGCIICATPPEPGRVCANATCEKPLHPQWPGLYCCYECAWRDAL